MCAATAAKTVLGCARYSMRDISIRLSVFLSFSKTLIIYSEITSILALLRERTGVSAICCMHPSAHNSVVRARIDEFIVEFIAVSAASRHKSVEMVSIAVPAAALRPTDVKKLPPPTL